MRKHSYFIAIWTFLCVLNISFAVNAESNLGKYISRLRNQSQNETSQSAEDTEKLLKILPNHENLIYTSEDAISFTVTPPQDGYLYLYDSNREQIFPGAKMPDNFIKADVPCRIPPENAGVKISFDGRLKTENVYFVLSPTPLNAFASAKESAISSTLYITVEDGESTSAPDTSASAASEPAVPASGTSNSRYFAIFSQTHVFNTDENHFEFDKNCEFRLGNAVQIYSALKNLGKFEELAFVMGPNLNKRNVYKTFQMMAERTNPGDEIFIYWEGHGGPVNGGDGSLEVLFLSTVKCDANQNLVSSNPEDYLTDKEFGDLIRTLKDRKVMILLESCHSGEMIDEGSKARGFSDSISENDIRNLGNFLQDYSSFKEKLPVILNPADVEPLWASSSTNSKNWRNFVRRSSITPRTPAFYFRTFQKDLNSGDKNIALITSCDDTESSWCPTIVPGEDDVLKIPCGSENSEANLPIGAPTCALLLVLLDQDGSITGTPGRPTFEDLANLTAYLVHINSKRASTAYHEYPEVIQTARYLNSLGSISIVP